MDNWPYFIALKRGSKALVDKEDVLHALQHNWTLTSHGYVKAIVDGVFTYLHRFIAKRAKFKPSKYLDHINGDRLDNRRSNLRPATSSQNCQNSKLSIRNKFGCKGIQMYRGRYHAVICVDGLRIALGTYATLEEAIRVRKLAEKDHFKDFKRV